MMLSFYEIPTQFYMQQYIITLLLPCLMMYYNVFVFAVFLVSCPCMAINVSVQYNGGLLPDIILLTQ